MAGALTKSFLASFLIALFVVSSASAGTIPFALGKPALSVSIYPPSASVNVGGSVQFTSNVTGDKGPFVYQWVLNGTTLSESSSSYTFRASARGTYLVYLKVYPAAFNDSAVGPGQSNTVRVFVGKQSLTGSFGYLNPSSQASGSGTQFDAVGSRFTLNVEANVTSMSCSMTYQRNPSYPNQNCSYLFAIYRDNLGAVSSLVAQTVRGTMNYFDQDVRLWYTLDFPSVVHLAPGAYWLMTVQNDTQNVMVTSDVVNGYESVDSFLSGMAFPSSLPSPLYFSNYVFSIYASWEVNVSASLTGDKDVLSVVSNSTVSPLAYNSSTKRLGFSVNGSSGTTGYTEVFISKTTLPDVEAVDVTLDGREVNFTSASLGDSWVLHFVYSHSTHNVSVGMQLNVIPEFPTLFLAGLVTIVFATFMCLTYLKKRYEIGSKGWSRNLD